MSKSAFWNLLPEIDSRVSAIQVTRQGVLAAALSCAITAVFSVLSAGGFNPHNLLDAVIFCVVAWRIYRLSLLWSIFGLIWFLIEKIYQLVDSTRTRPNVLGWIIAAAFVMCYVNSIRATWFLRKNKEPMVEPTDQISISN
ncbi:MAG: hypothetical protein ABSC88_05835 [Terracidiphilus sp.]|jgi:hypothetical protein